MGVFRDWQPRYLAEGIATFPMAFVQTEDGKVDKKPLVKGYLKIGTNRSGELATKQRFADCDGIGFGVVRPYGPKITVLDIDKADESLVGPAIERHGDTPIIVRTATRKYHLYYRHNGEPRQIRPWGEDIPIDLLGGGFVVAPGSISPQGRYEFLRGDLSQIKNLPAMRGIDDLLKPTKAVRQRPEDTQVFLEGTRNKAFFIGSMRQARRVQNFDELLAFAREYNEGHMRPPLTDIQVVRTAVSAWEYELRGENFVDGGGFTVMRTDALDELDPDSYYLISQIKRYHWGRDQFVLTGEFARKLGWNLKRFVKARRVLESRGHITVLHRGGRGAGTPSQYGWPVRRLPTK